MWSISCDINIAGGSVTLACAREDVLATGWELEVLPARRSDVVENSCFQGAKQSRAGGVFAYGHRPGPLQRAPIAFARLITGCARRYPRVTRGRG